MKSTSIFVLTLAVVAWCSPALAQHGHGGGMGGSMDGNGAGMSHHAANANSNVVGSHGQTMNDILTRNAQLAGKIQTLTGMPAEQACSGFKNLGQCVAAAHVSKNLDISFACLRAEMTGTRVTSNTSCPAHAGSKSMSLGKAIQSLSPNTNSKTEAKRGEKQADLDLKEAKS